MALNNFSIFKIQTMKQKKTNSKLLLSKKTVAQLNGVLASHLIAGFGGPSNKPNDPKCTLDACQKTYTENNTCGTNCQTGPPSEPACRTNKAY
jgi:predicted TIM-barrel enzyme